MTRPIRLSSAALALVMTVTACTSGATHNPAAYVEGQPYQPTIDAANFVDVVDNPFFPLVPGTVYTFEGSGEHVVVTVTHDTKEILGITTTVVHDQVTVDGAVTEDTTDWYAQDAAGNVWYMGEQTAEYENGVVTIDRGHLGGGRGWCPAGDRHAGRPAGGGHLPPGVVRGPGGGSRQGLRAGRVGRRCRPARTPVSS